MSLTAPNTPTDTVPKWVTRDGTKFRAIVFETAVDASLDTVWAELHDNYVGIQDTHAAIKASYGLPGEPVSGLGAVRHCDLDFKGKDVAIKERIIDLVDRPDHKEFTYDVYETKGFPARVYNTWRVRRGSNGDTLLSNVFYYRMQPSALTRPFARQIAGAAQGGVLGFKHFFETGERKAPADKINELYAAA